MTTARLDILIKKIETMQTALGVNVNAKSTFFFGSDKNAIAPLVKKEKLSEFENALLMARNKLKETEDKLEERMRKIEFFGSNSRERIGSFFLTLFCPQTKIITNTHFRM